MTGTGDSDIHDALVRLSEVPITEAFRGKVDAMFEACLNARLRGAEGSKSRLLPGMARVRRRLGRVAAVLALVCLLVIGALWLSGRDGLTPSVYAEVEEAIRNSRQAEWVHWEELQTDRWFSLHPPRAAWKFASGQMRYIDYESNRRLSYTPDTRTITISWQREEQKLEGVASLWNYLLAEIERQKKQGNLLETSTAEVDGRPCQVFAFAAEGRGVRLFVDMERRRLVRMEVLPPKGEALVMDYEYPTHGPEDIYELGAPRDARVVDLTAPVKARELKGKVEEAARAALPQYYAIVCKRMKDYDVVKGEGLTIPTASVSVIYAKADRRRVETYVPERPDMTYAQSRDYHKVLWDQLPAEDMEALEKWIVRRRPIKVIFYETGQATKIKLDDAGKLARRRYESSLPVQPVQPWIWCLPIRLKNVRVLEPKDGEWGRLVGFESSKVINYAKWFFNPGRNYVCEFHEWGTDNQRAILEPGYRAPGDPYRNTHTLKLDEYARTSRGFWYPRKQTQVDYMTGYGSETYVIINHVDDTRPVPEALFDPDRIRASELAPWH